MIKSGGDSNTAITKKVFSVNNYWINDIHVNSAATGMFSWLRNLKKLELDHIIGGDWAVSLEVYAL